MNSNVIKPMPEIKLSKDAKNASIDKISDEEIKAEADRQFRYFEEEEKFIWWRACAWYREQLKLRQ